MGGRGARRRAGATAAPEVKRNENKTENGNNTETETRGGRMKKKAKEWYLAIWDSGFGPELSIRTSKIR